MAGIKLTEEEMQYISLFEAVTQVEARDCVVDGENNRVVFLVKQGMAGKAIGSNGANVKILRKLLGKDVEIVEESDTLEGLVQAALFPARVKAVEIREYDNAKVAIVEVPAEQKGIAIGKGGRTIKRAKLLLKRYFGVDLVLK